MQSVQISTCIYPNLNIDLCCFLIYDHTDDSRILR